MPASGRHLKEGTPQLPRKRVVPSQLRITFASLSTETTRMHDVDPHAWLTQTLEESCRAGQFFRPCPGTSKSRRPNFALLFPPVRPTDAHCSRTGVCHGYYG